MTEREAPDAELAAQRAAIDAVDHALLELVARRRALVAEIFDQKRASGLPLVDPAREQALLADRRAAAERFGVPGALAEQIFRVLLEGSHAQAEAGAASVVLPSPGVPPARPSMDLSQEQRAHSILLIEDNRDIAEAVTALLRMEGYAVRTTPSGLQGLVDFARERFDLVLLDLQVDDLSGLGVERAIRDLSEVPVVVMSAQIALCRREVFLAGATACVPKPFDADDLLSLMATLLGRKPEPPAWADQVQSLGQDDLDRLARMSLEEHDVLPFGVICVDRELRIVGFNSYERDATGMQSAAVIGKDLREIAPCCDVREFIGMMSDGIARGRLDEVLRFIFPYRTSLAVVSIRLYYDGDHERAFVFISRRASGPWMSVPARTAS